MAFFFRGLINTGKFWIGVFEANEQPITKSLPQGSILWLVLFNRLLSYMVAGVECTELGNFLTVLNWEVLLTFLRDDRPNLGI